MILLQNQEESDENIPREPERDQVSNRSVKEQFNQALKASGISFSPKLSSCTELTAS